MPRPLRTPRETADFVDAFRQHLVVVLESAHSLDDGDLLAFARLLKHDPPSAAQNVALAKLLDAVARTVVQLGGVPAGTGFELLPYELPLAMHTEDAGPTQPPTTISAATPEPLDTNRGENPCH
jgi:hypothetical protein